MMKTFDEIYQELKTEDMQEINKLYECVKKKSKKVQLFCFWCESYFSGVIFPL